MLTVCYTMFDPKPETILKHLELWETYPRDKIQFIVVDDCSAEPVVINPDYPINLIVARITTDIYWNLPGARNLAFNLADYDWCVNLDMDHFILAEDIKALLEMNKERGKVYRFRRVRIENGEHKEHTIHRDSFIMHKADYDKIGGYEEDLCGHRGGNEDLIDAKLKFYNFQIVNTKVTVFNDETHGKVGGFRRELVTPNYVKLRRITEQIRNGTFIPGSQIRFQWEIVKDLRI